VPSLSDELDFVRQLGGSPLDEEPEQQPEPFDEEAFVASLHGSAPEPAVDPDRVRMFAPDGSAVTVPKLDMQRALDEGYQTAEQQHQAALEAEYGGAGGAALAGAMGGLRGLSLGLSDAASAALTGALTPEAPQLTPEARARAEQMGLAVPEDKGSFLTGYEAAREYQRGLQEAHPTASLTGELGGALLGGGAGLVRGTAGRMLSATPAALATRAAVASSEAAAARLGGGVMGRIGATALGSAVEGGIAGAAVQVADAVPEFATDPAEAAEHLLAGAGEGALLGAAIGGGLMASGELARAAGRGALSLTDSMMGSLMPSTDTLRQLAGESAYKAAVGRTSKAAMKFADRHGGAAAVGKTLLDEGVPLAGSAEEILEATSRKADEVGAALGAKVKEIDALGGIPVSRAEVMQRIDDEVLAPLRGNVFGQDILAAVERKIEPFRGAMSAGERPVMVRGADGATRAVNRDAISFEELHAMRRDLDQTLRYESAGPPTPTTQVMRDVRTVLEDSWLEAAERSAQSVGVDGFADSVRGLKRKYAHLRLAADQAEEAVQTQLANRSLSLTDNIWGAGAAGALTAGGGLFGLAAGAGTAVAHKMVRERGRGIAAIAFNQMADLAERKTSLVALSASGQQRLARTAQALVERTGRAAYAAEGAAISKFSERDLQEAIAEAQELEDPSSETSAHLHNTAQQLDMVNPGMGQAYAQTVVRRSQMIRGMLPTKPLSTAVFSPQRQLDPTTERKVHRAIAASHEPQKALERVAAGNHSPEDLRAVKTVYPAMWKRFQQSVLEQFRAMQRPPSHETRLRIAYATGLNLDPTVEPGAIQMLQRVAQSPDQQQQAEAKQDASAQAVAQQFKPIDADSVYAAPVDARIDRR